MDLLHDLAETWAQPPMRHAMLVHAPIALAMLALPVALLSALRGSSHALRTSALVLLALVAVGGHLAAWSGEEAEGTVESALSEEGEHVLHEHEEIAEWVRFAAAAAAGLVALGYVDRAALRRAAGWGGFLLSAATAWIVADAAHLGGELVYEHGAGGVNVRLAIPAEPPDDPRLEHFRAEVLPLLADTCWRCHNAERSRGGLDQTSIAGLLRGGESGPALVPGRPEESLMLRAVRHEVPELEMPPMGRLEDAQIESLRRWIAEGAAWEAPAAQR